MSTLRDAFERQADRAGAPAVDLDHLVRLGEHRLRRRWLAAALASTTAIVLAVAIAVTAFGGGGRPRPAPVDRPSGHDVIPTRPVVYSDAPAGLDDRSGMLHVGDRVVAIGGGFVHSDVTDDGVVYSTGGYQDDGRVWFTAGGAPEQIGSHACAAPHGLGETVVTGNAGSLVAWFDCTRTHGRELVVFDTGSGHEVARRRIGGCGASSPCSPAAILGDRVYFGTSRAGGRALDLSTGRLTTDRSYADDLRNHARGLVIGDSWQEGRPTQGIGQPFWVDGDRLVALDRTWTREPVPGDAFDTLTRRQVRLHLPSDYRGHHDRLGRGDFWLFEWLDDDTVALVGPHGWDDTPGYGDILTCRLSSGACELAVSGRGPVRVVANGDLPG